MTREAPRSLVYVLLPLMLVFWSANYAIGKVALREFPPVLAASLRITMAGAFILPLYAWQQGRASWMNRDWLHLFLLGLFGVTMNQVFFVMGLGRTSVVHSSLMIAMTPIYVLMIAAAIKQEQMTFRKAAGMVIALGGVGILNAMPGGAKGEATLFGDFLTFVGAVAFALFTVFGKNVTGRHSTVTVNTFSYVGGALALAPITLWQARSFAFAGVSMTAWMSLAYMALFPSVICYLIYYRALAFIPASRVSALSYLQPVLATIMAAIALGERVTLPLVAGGAVIFSGVYLTERG